eukprot:Nk52_evm45s153 gene=Nk52_evmTU45s153
MPHDDTLVVQTGQVVTFNGTVNPHAKEFWGKNARLVVGTEGRGSGEEEQQAGGGEDPSSSSSSSTKQVQHGLEEAKPLRTPGGITPISGGKGSRATGAPAGLSMVSMEMTAKGLGEKAKEPVLPHCPLGLVAKPSLQWEDVAGMEKSRHEAGGLFIEESEEEDA